MRVLKAYSAEVRTLSFCADGVHLAAAAVTSISVLVWNPARKTPGRRSGASGLIYRVEFAGRGTALLVWQRHGTALWASAFADQTPTIRWPSCRATFRAGGAEVAWL